MSLHPLRDTFGKWMKDTVAMPQEDFERELQNIPVSGAKLILEAVDALPPARGADETSDDGTVISRNHRQQEATPNSSPTRSSPGDTSA
ncbi:UNVERIFIED_CONTAM: hypothetical protein HDU68_006175 [Siphonaria sp. JEL0065]|nr:hypothetical protein HDU68_006175 [Siphonaria sp. JEL0065]